MRKILLSVNGLNALLVLGALASGCGDPVIVDDTSRAHLPGASDSTKMVEEPEHEPKPEVYVTGKDFQTSLTGYQSTPHEIGLFGFQFLAPRQGCTLQEMELSGKVDNQYHSPNKNEWRCSFQLRNAAGTVVKTVKSDVVIDGASVSRGYKVTFNPTVGLENPGTGEEPLLSLVCLPIDTPFGETTSEQSPGNVVISCNGKQQVIKYGPRFAQGESRFVYTIRRP